MNEKSHPKLNVGEANLPKNHPSELSEGLCENSTWQDSTVETGFKSIHNDKNNNVERIEFCQQMLGSKRLEFLDELKEVQLLLDLKKHSDKKVADEVNLISKEFDNHILESAQSSEISEMDLLTERTQVHRQYPISSHVKSEMCQDENDFSDDSSEYLEEKTEFVRNGFGRMSTISAKSVGPGSENFKSVDEITISRSVFRKPSHR